MILSMTGFGRSEGIYDGKKITVEIKSLNSKTFDLNTRIPLRYKEKEFDIRKKLNENLLRGKVECFIGCEIISEQGEVKINQPLIKAYMNALKECADDGPDFEYLKMAVRFPDAISAKPDELTEEEGVFLMNLVHEAVEKIIGFRKIEGEVLRDDFIKCVDVIRKHLTAVEPYEAERMVNIKEKYLQALQEYDKVDETRFYQEMAYLAEKLDISEEKVRLAQHLDYFHEVMQEKQGNGKKLGFIAQEMGREINTLGSKANHAEIQKLVVKMKDELERIKEQTLNVL